MRVVLPAMLASLLPIAAAAQLAGDGAAPDPATVSVPNVTAAVPASVQSDGWKRFFFWKDGVGYAEAYADFADCYRFLGGSRPVGPEPLPETGAWASVPTAERRRPVDTQYGVVGAAIGGLVAGPMNRRVLQSRMRRCMEPRGYIRFPAAEDTWKRLVDGYSRGSIAVQAKVAAGPRPASAPVTR